ncbi:peroxiredoxin [Beijerinckia indica]|nr:peroxiredoxin [Beijerinckia indica]
MPRFCLSLSLSLVVALIAASPAFASLKIGTRAPDFTVPAARAGQVFTFSLAEALQRGPVVVYFYPAAFTSGCTVEAHDFAEAMNDFEALGATVIGVSHDAIDTLSKFSVSECRGKFPVAADVDQAVMKNYDSVLIRNPLLAERTSYVIAPDGTILAVYSNSDPSEHVGKMLAALKAWKAKSPVP